MKKKLIFVASPPACGKTYVSELIAKTVGHMVYLDKDDLADLLRSAFKVANENVNMDGQFYLEHLRPSEYSTILHIAYSSLRFEDMVILNAPFGKEVKDIEYMKSLKKKANEYGADLILIWIDVPKTVCYERMKARNSDRDTLKLLDWDNYIKNVNFIPPYHLEKQNAVDQLIIFDNTDENCQRSLENTIKIILGE